MIFISKQNSYNMTSDEHYYNSIAKGYDLLHGTEQKRKFTIISANINPKDSDKLLDIGCGTGIGLNYFSCKYFGIEPSEKMLEIAKEKAKKKQVDAELILGTGEEISKKFAGKKFDFIICVSSAHHINDFETFLDSLQNISEESTQYVFSLLKRSKTTKNILESINKKFNIKKQIEDEKDLIVFFQ